MEDTNYGTTLCSLVDLTNNAQYSAASMVEVEE
jgi:hypothetical protein